MQPDNPLFALIIFIIAFLSAKLLRFRYRIAFPGARYETIDGLRGFLALGVFIHHAVIWYQYLPTGEWKAPVSNFYNQLGQSSVMLFFMITSFLFVGKLLDEKNKTFDWKRFFISRMYRLMPLYYFSVAAMIIFIFCITHWRLNLAFPKFLEQVLNWLLFTINKQSLLNNSMLTPITNAGVVWSLPFEWLFYFCLPLIALLILKVKPARVYIILSIVFVVIFCIVHSILPYCLLAFVGGAAAAFIIRRSSIIGRIKEGHAAIIIPACLAMILLFHSVNFICIILLTIIFTTIASGRSVFGIFTNKTLQFLGDISYSTYLLHGLLYFAGFYFVFGFEKAGALSASQFCNTVFIITPLLVLLSFAGFTWIERPFINRAKRMK